MMETQTVVLIAIELEARPQALAGSTRAHGYPRNVPQDVGHHISNDPKMGSSWIDSEPRCDG